MTTEQWAETATEASIDFLSREHNGAQDRDQYQNAGDFERQQVSGEQRAADVERRAVRKVAEADCLRRRHRSTEQVSDDAEERDQQRNPSVLSPRALEAFTLGARIQKHDDEYEQH